MFKQYFVLSKPEPTKYPHWSVKKYDRETRRLELYVTDDLVEELTVNQHLLKVGDDYILSVWVDPNATTEVFCQPLGCGLELTPALVNGDLIHLSDVVEEDVDYNQLHTTVGNDISVGFFEKLYMQHGAGGELVVYHAITRVPKAVLSRLQMSYGVNASYKS